MTTKYESVLSESEINRICIQASAGKQGLQSDRSVSRATEQAVLAKLQPQLDSLMSALVSEGQRLGIIRNDLDQVSTSEAMHILKTITGQLDDIGAGGVSGQRVRMSGQPPRKQTKNTEETPCINTQYSDFKKWCDDNPSFDLDARLHTHSGRLGDGGYISDEKTRIAFSAYRAATKTTPAGYKLVPIDITEKMHQAAVRTLIGCNGNDDFPPMVYSATLAAAPTPDIKDSLTTENQELRIVFSGEAPNLEFIDVENEDGFSVNAGEWHKRFDGYTELRIKAAKE